MIAETLSIGTELLLGQIVDTNAAYIAQELSKLGITLYFRSTVGDNSQRMREAIDLALSRSDLIITIGGLGPTMDDLTKETVAEQMGVQLVPDMETQTALRALSLSRGFRSTDSFLKQALVPASDGEPIDNPNGTAPGIVIRKEGKIAICLPGPPNELMPMVEQSVVPMLSKLTSGSPAVIRSKVLRVIGMGESLVEDAVKDLMLGTNPSLAPYAKMAECHLRITARAPDNADAERLINPLEQQVRDRLGDTVYGVDQETLEYAVVELLKKHGRHVATAESCTGGLLSQRITSISGSSAVFRTGIASYANETKCRLLGVPADMLANFGAVSPQVAQAMAEGIRRLDQADFGIGITGIAGPDGGSPDKPVGLVYIALATAASTYVIEQRYGGSRDDIRYRASQTALAALRTELLAHKTGNNDESEHMFA